MNTTCMSGYLKDKAILAEQLNFIDRMKTELPDWEWSITKRGYVRMRHPRNYTYDREFFINEKDMTGWNEQINLAKKVKK